MNENWPLSTEQHIYEFTVAQKEYATTDRSLQSLKEMLQRHNEMCEIVHTIVDNSLSRLTQIELAEASYERTRRLRLVITNVENTLIAIDNEFKIGVRRQWTQTKAQRTGDNKKSCVVQ